MKDRGQRRHDDKRVKAKVRRIIKDRIMVFDPLKEPVEPTAKAIGRQAAVHAADCSCAMCGNPRRHFKGKSRLTKQEWLAMDRMKDHQDE